MSSFSARLAAASAAAITVTAAGLAAVTTAPAGAATGTYTQTRLAQLGSTEETVFGGQLNILDGTMAGPKAASPYPSSSTQVNGLAGTVTDVVLTINGFDHEAPRDTDIMLVAPSGERALVMSDVGGADPVTDVVLEFSDTSSTYLNFDDKVASGTYHPSNDSLGDYFPTPAPSVTGVASSMSAFDGAEPNGFWYLYVVDDLMVYTGGIDSWAVTIRTTGGEYPSTLAVAGAPGTITDLDVELEIDHGRFDEIDVLLVGPGGQQATLLSDAGGPNEVDGATFVLDDSAPLGVPDPVTPGTYRPTNLDPAGDSDLFLPPAPQLNGNTKLSAFNGTDPNGTWSLYLADDSRKYRGYVADWSLRITTTDPVTPSPTPTSTPTQTPTTDTLHPRVESVRPGGRAVRRGATIVATLDERLRPGSVNRATAYLVRKGSTMRVRAKVTWSAGTNRLVIDPKRPLRAGTTYTAMVTTAVTDLAGNRLDQDPGKTGLQPKRWRFTTR